MQPTSASKHGVRLCEALPVSAGSYPAELRFTACTRRATECRPGDLYVALTDRERDGHGEAELAVRHGAAAVVAERRLPVPVPQCVVPDSHEAFARLCLALVGNPQHDLQTIGVTGTNGKTVTSSLIASLLAAAGYTAGSLTSLARNDARVQSAAHTTTPAPPELAQWMARMAAHGCSHQVMELSSRGLAERRAAGIEFDLAVVTNLRRAHIDYHGSVREYRRAKRRLLEQLAPHGVAVLNADDPVSQTWLDELDGPAITFGQHAPAEVTARVVERHSSEQTFLLAAGHEVVPVRTRMIGDHHVSNCLAAAAVGLILDIPLATIVRGLEAVEHLPGRLQRLECGQPFGVFVDAASTPDQLAVCLRALRRVTRGRLICVFSADHQYAEDDRPLMGRVVEKGADCGVLTSHDGQSAVPDEVVHEILDGYERPARGHLIPSRHRAVTWALEQAAPGDTVLIAGSGGLEWGNRRAAGDVPTATQWLYESPDPPERPVKLQLVN